MLKFLSLNKSKFSICSFFIFLLKIVVLFKLIFLIDLKNLSILLIRFSIFFFIVVKLILIIINFIELKISFV